MAIFNSYVSHYQRVKQLQIHRKKQQPSPIQSAGLSSVYATGLVKVASGPTFGVSGLPREQWP
jgi:hypothetical protein